MTPPDPMSLDPRGLLELLVGRPALPQPALPRPRQPGAADDDERGRLPRPVVRDRRAEGDDVRRRASSARSSACARRARPTCCCTTTWARSTARSDRGAWRAAARARSRTRSRRRPRRAAPRSAPRRRSARILTRDGRATGVVLENGDELDADVVLSSVDPRLTFLNAARAERELPDDFLDGVRRYKFRGSSGKVNLALDALPDFTCLPGRGRAPARRDLDLAGRRLHGARLRRREVRALLAPALHRHRDPVADRSVAWRRRASTSCRASCSTRRTTWPRARWDDQREAFGDAVVDTIAEYAPNIKDIILHRQVLTPLDLEREFGLTRGQHLPGRAVARAAVLPAAGAGLGAVRDAGPQAVHVRLGHASRRRHHGRARPQRRRAHPEGRAR